jgi:hypothetical protein
MRTITAIRCLEALRRNSKTNISQDLIRSTGCIMGRRVATRERKSWRIKERLNAAKVLNSAMTGASCINGDI